MPLRAFAPVKAGADALYMGFSLIVMPPFRSVRSDGKIHYMEDAHTANHHAAEEERICMGLVKERRVNFLR